MPENVFKKAMGVLCACVWIMGCTAVCLGSNVNSDVKTFITDVNKDMRAADAPASPKEAVKITIPSAQKKDAAKTPPPSPAATSVAATASAVGPAILGMQLGMTFDELVDTARKYGGTITQPDGKADKGNVVYEWDAALTYGLLPFPNLHDKTVYLRFNPQKNVFSIEFPKNILSEIVSVFDEGDTFLEKFANRYGVTLRKATLNGQDVWTATDAAQKEWTVYLYPEKSADPKDVAAGVARVLLVADTEK